MSRGMRGEIRRERERREREEEEKRRGEREGRGGGDRGGDKGRELGSIMILAAKQSSELSAFRLGHCSPVGKVRLIGNEDEGNVITVLGPHDLVPEERGLVEGGP